MKRPSFALPIIDLHLIGSRNDEFKEGRDRNAFSMSDSRYCDDGLSVGNDYLRFEGITISRGKICPGFLSLEETIGRGAFNKVQRAVWNDPQSLAPREVAVKEYPLLAGTSQQKRQMLVQELRSLCKTESKCLIKMFGAYLEKNSVLLVLELMGRGSLEHVLGGRKTPFSHPMLAGVAFQLSKGLAYLHTKRIIHRDIKTENCLMNADGFVKLGDFGLASLGDRSMHSTTVGTTYFMSPERLRAKEYGAPSDIWSLGLVLIHLATDNRPWGSVSSIVDLLVTVEEALLEDLIPPSLESGIKDILAGCLQLTPQKRMPACILHKSPWFKHHGITNQQQAANSILEHES